MRTSGAGAVSGGAAGRYRDPESVTSAFRQTFGETPRLFAAPGRINLIGEHTDYNDGLVLPAAVDLHTWMAAAPRSDRRLNVVLGPESGPLEIDLDRLEPDGSGGSAEYLKGVAWALQSEGVAVGGCNLVVGGNIPLGGGLSSSASLELTLAVVLTALAGGELTRERLATLCRRAEAEFVGMPCGVMDQYAVALGRRGHALRLDCRSLECELVPIPDRARLLIVHSGVSHRLQASEYGRRREECARAVDRLRARRSDVQSLRDLGLDELERLSADLDPVLRRRCRHVVTENRRVELACRALLDDDLETLGALMDASHASLRDDYEVSCSEVDSLVEIARNEPGVLGSRMMGGGFGGCTISLVEADALERVAVAIVRSYGELLGRPPWMHVAGPADPAGEWGSAADGASRPARE